MAFAAQARTSDNVVTGLWRGAGIPPIPEQGADHYITSITEAEYKLASATGLFYGGDASLPRYIINADTLEEQADPRPRIIFLERSTTKLQHTVLRQVGQPDLVLDVAKIIGDSEDVTLDTAFNGDIQLRVNDGRWVHLPFTNGMSTLTIKALEPREWIIAEQGNANIVGPQNYLRCRVFAAAEL